MDAAPGRGRTELCPEDLAAVLQMADRAAGRGVDFLDIVLLRAVGIGRARSQDVGFPTRDAAYAVGNYDRQTAGRAGAGLLRGTVRGSRDPDCRIGRRIVSRHGTLRLRISRADVAISRIRRHVAFDAARKPHKSRWIDRRPGVLRTHTWRARDGEQWAAGIRGAQPANREIRLHRTRRFRPCSSPGSLRPRNSLAADVFS